MLWGILRVRSSPVFSSDAMIQPRDLPCHLQAHLVARSPHRTAGVVVGMRLMGIVGIISLVNLAVTGAIAQSNLPGAIAPAPVSTAATSAGVDNLYTLGAGDQIRMDIFDVPEFSGANGTFTILLDGSLNLPWIGRVVVQGLTLDQAAALLTERYAPLIREPLITVTLLTPRPLRIGVVGEVTRPGVYTVSLTESGGAVQWRTVTQAIQLAGGITQLADIRQIEIHRPQLDGSTVVLQTDLWAFLQGGDLRQDLNLRDGDTVVIPTATSLNPEEASELAIANFSPDEMQVNVVGEVPRPGAVELVPNSTLNQAILAAGGFDAQRARRSSVTLIRLNPNGTVSRRSVEVDFSAGLNEETNPALRHNDIIIVGRSSLAATADSLETLLRPLNGLFGIFRLFGGL